MKRTRKNLAKIVNFPKPQNPKENESSSNRK